MFIDTFKEKELSQISGIKRIWNIPHTEEFKTRTPFTEEKVSIQNILRLCLQLIFKLEQTSEEFSKIQIESDISSIIQNIIQKGKLIWLQHSFKLEQTSEELKQQALFRIVEKFSKIEKVKSIYVQRYREELQIFVLFLGNKYDANLMDHLLDIEYEIRKEFPDIVFQFFYPPAGISEKKDFIHPQAECIYINPFLPFEKEKDVLREIEEIYEFSDKERVRNFILQNSDLIKILEEAPAYIYKIFGKNIKLFLELHSDPEENWDELFIIIKSSYPPEKAYELERKLFNEWFINIIKIVGNKLNFTEEPL